MPDWSDFLSGRREYALLSELLAFVADRIGGEDAAKEFILNWYQYEESDGPGESRPFPWRFDSLELNTVTQDPRAARRYFWRKLECVAINWKSSGATYNGPRIVGKYDDSKEWPMFEYDRLVSIRASLVQFPVKVAIERLRFLEMLPPSLASWESKPEPEPEPGPEKHPSGSKRRHRRRDMTSQPQQAPARRVLDRLLAKQFPDMETLPPRAKLKDKDLYTAFVDEWRRVEGKRLGDPPSLSTVLRAAGRKS